MSGSSNAGFLKFDYKICKYLDVCGAASRTTQRLPGHSLLARSVLVGRLYAEYMHVGPTRSWLNQRKAGRNSSVILVFGNYFFCDLGKENPTSSDG